MVVALLLSCTDDVVRRNSALLTMSLAGYAIGGVACGAGFEGAKEERAKILKEHAIASKFLPLQWFTTKWCAESRLSTNYVEVIARQNVLLTKDIFEALVFLLDSCSDRFVSNALTVCYCRAGAIFYLWA